MLLSDKVERLMGESAPRVLPVGWLLEEQYANARIWRRGDGLRVIGEVAEYDGRHWLHVSCSTPGRIPTWEELKLVKQLFCGRDKLALQVLPPDSEYVNINPHVLHLWVALEGPRPAPDFTRGRREI